MHLPLHRDGIKILKKKNIIFESEDLPSKVLIDITMESGQHCKKICWD